MIKPEVLRAMLAAGASAEMIVLAVEADYNSRREQREADATRKRVSRGLRRTSADTPPPSSFSPTPPHITTPSPDLANAKSIKNPSECPFFKEFWEVYPRKIGKGEARKAFRNAIKRATAEEIIAGARRYAASKPDPEYTKHPGPWLNADRWLDEPVKPQSNVVGFRKELPPEPPRPARSPEEQAKIDAKIAGLLKAKRM